MANTNPREFVRIKLLSDYLEVPVSHVRWVDTMPGEYLPWEYPVYEVGLGNGKKEYYYVLTEDEAEQFYYDQARNEIDNDVVGWDIIEKGIDEDIFRDGCLEDLRDNLDSLDSEELVEKAYDLGVIDDDDLEEDGDFSTYIGDEDDLKDEIVDYYEDEFRRGGLNSLEEYWDENHSIAELLNIDESILDIAEIAYQLPDSRSMLIGGSDEELELGEGRDGENYIAIQDFFRSYN